MLSHQIKSYLYNNPYLYGGTMKPMGGDKWQMINVPHIDIVAEKIENGVGTIELKILSTSSKEVYMEEKELQVLNNKFSIEFKFKEPLDNPEIARVKIKINKKKILYEGIVKTHKIYGKVTDFDDKPVSAYVWAIPERELSNVIKKGFDGTVVKADENGKYELWLPEEKINGIFVDDESYHRDTYECWLWDVNLTKDIGINPHIDKAEIYNLHVWPSYLDYNSLHIHFIPCSLTRDLNRLPLKLTKQNIKVYANDRECEIKTFSEHMSWRMSTQPSYILDIESENFNGNNVIVKVQLEIKSELKGKIIEEKGEAYFLRFY